MIGGIRLKSVVRPCPVCGNTSGEVLHTQRFILPEGHPLSAGYDVVVCTQCGFGYADTSVDQRDYEEFYAKFSKYADNRTSTGGGESAWDAERLQATAADIARIVPDKSARMVDIGCANGGLLRALRDLGYTNLCGLDLSPACVRQTKESPGVDAYIGSLSQIPSEAGPFDCVILLHVLEHVKDLQSAMIYVRQFLNRGAYLYVETPDATRYADYVFAPFQDFNTEHINHFSLTSMANLLCRCGFTPTVSDTKVILSAPDMPYPALYTFATLAGNDAESASEIQNDTDLKQRLGDYIAISRQLMDEIDTHLQRVLADAPEVLVWGTGQLAMKLLAETTLANANIVAFVDGNPVNQGKYLRGIPIIAPCQVEASTRPIIITSTMHHRAIAQNICQLGLSNPVIALRPELVLPEQSV
jgi:2-polyprenyl-3-methyl-5-hydroxy-6-metoxy-1,4-benzoquinol methylase